MNTLGAPQYYLRIGNIDEEDLIKDFCDKYSKCDHDGLLYDLKSLNETVFDTFEDLHDKISNSFDQYSYVYNKDHRDLLFTIKQKEETINLKNPKLCQDKIMQYEYTPLSTYLNIQRTKFEKCGKGHNLLQPNRTYESRIKHIRNCGTCQTEFEKYSADEIANGCINIEKYTEKFNEIKKTCQILNEQYQYYLDETLKPLQKEIKDLTNNAQEMSKFLKNYTIHKKELVDKLIDKYSHTQFTINGIIQEKLQKIHLVFDDKSETKYDVTLIDIYASLLEIEAKESFNSINK